MDEVLLGKIRALYTQIVYLLEMSMFESRKKVKVSQEKITRNMSQ